MESFVEALVETKLEARARRLLAIWICTTAVVLFLVGRPGAERIGIGGEAMAVLFFSAALPAATVLCGAVFFPNSVPKSSPLRIYWAMWSMALWSGNAYTNSWETWVEAEAAVGHARWVRRAMAVVWFAQNTWWVVAGTQNPERIWPATRLLCVANGTTRLLGTGLLAWLEEEPTCSALGHPPERLPLAHATLLGCTYIALGAFFTESRRQAIASKLGAATVKLQLSELSAAPPLGAAPKTELPAPSEGRRRRKSGESHAGSRMSNGVGSGVGSGRSCGGSSLGSSLSEMGGIWSLASGSPASALERERGRPAGNTSGRSNSGLHRRPPASLPQAARDRNEVLWHTLRRAGILPHAEHAADSEDGTTETGSEEFQATTVARAVQIHRAGCSGLVHGLRMEGQRAAWRGLVDDMVDCRFEGRGGNEALVAAIGRCCTASVGKSE